MTLKFSALDGKLYDNALAERFLLASATLHWDRLDHEYVSTAFLQSRGLLGETGPMTDTIGNQIEFDGGAARPSTQTAAVAGAPGTPVTVTVSGVGGPNGGFALVTVVLAGAVAEPCPVVTITPNMTPGNAATAISASIDQAHGAGVSTFVSTNVVTATAFAPVTAITGVMLGGAALAAGAYEIDIDRQGAGWVRLLSGDATLRAEVSGRAGLSEGWNGVPEPLRAGIVRLAAHLFTHRDDPETEALPAAVTALWRPWRTVSL